MDYFLGKDSRKLNVKNQVAIPAEFIRTIKERNKAEHERDIYMTVAYASEASVPFVKCFDYTAFRQTVKGVIDAGELHKATLDKQGRFVIPKRIMDEAGLDSLDRIVMVEAESGKCWGMTFAIYELDNYHKMKARQQHLCQKRKR
jgi:DNA-binding transcriptional regulator/RsmH inhibitor MraZ